MSIKKPGLTKAEHFALIHLLYAMSDTLCSESVRISNAYPLSNPPKKIRGAIKLIDKARMNLLDCRLSMEDRFFEENPNYPGLLGRDAGEREAYHGKH